MSFETVKHVMEIEAVEIPTMAKMNEDEYTAHLENLFYSDTHGIIRATQGDYSLACNQNQLKMLLNYLHGKMSSLQP